MKRPCHKVLSSQADFPVQRADGAGMADFACRSLDDFAYAEGAKHLLTVFISPEYAQEHFVLPLSFSGQELTVAVIDSERRDVVQSLKRTYEPFYISWVLIDEGKFAELYNDLYQRPIKGLPTTGLRADTMAPASRGQHTTGSTSGQNPEPSGPPPNVHSDGSVDFLDHKDLVNAVISSGIKHRASEIHFEQEQGRGKLRYRIDGVLRELEPGWLQEKIQVQPDAFVSCLKALANLDLSRHHRPQNRVFRFVCSEPSLSGQDDLLLQLATCPSINGENCTIRILDACQVRPGLDMLDHSPRVLQSLKTFLSSKTGLILVAGPPGSGKTTTLYAALEFLRAPSRKIITAEDPIAGRLPGVMQVAVNPERGLTAARLLRSFLPLAPDVVMLDKLCDYDSIRLGFDVAPKGPLFLSSMPAADSLEVLARLEAAGINRTEIAAGLSCVLVQRLVRRICPSCRGTYIPEAEEWGRLFADYPSQLTFFRGKGCDVCDFTGFKGRTILSELLVLDVTEAAAWRDGGGDLPNAAGNGNGGLHSLLDDGLLKLADTTLAEILRVVSAAAVARFRQQAGLVSVEELKKGRSFLLSDPIGQQDRIDRMYEFYRELTFAMMKTKVVERELFHRFISTSYEEIKRSAQNGAITFNFTGAGDRVQITAIPRY